MTAPPRRRRARARARADPAVGRVLAQQPARVGIVVASRDREDEIAGDQRAAAHAALSNGPFQVGSPSGKWSRLATSTRCMPLIRKKLRNMKASRPVHRIERAAQHAAPGSRSARRARRQPCRMSSGRHGRGLERNAVVAVALVEPPALVEQAPFPLQPAEQRRAGERRQVVEGGEVEAVVDGEVHRLVEGLAPCRRRSRRRRCRRRGCRAGADWRAPA